MAGHHGYDYPYSSGNSNSRIYQSNSSDRVRACLGDYDSKQHISNQPPRQTVETYYIPSNTVPSTESHSRTEKVFQEIYHETTWPSSNVIKIVCISDTHNGHQKTSFRDKIRRMQGDILIHAGDFSDRGSDEEVMSAFSWLCSLDNFLYKIFIAGNMDGIGLDDRRKRIGKQQLSDRKKGVIYLENSSCEVYGITIYGCPYTPKFCGGFQYEPGSSDAKTLWQSIPRNCDILVSHGPPYGILDRTSRNEHVGCRDLRQAVQAHNSLKAVIFGHVHNSYGYARLEDKYFINAAQHDGIYRVNNDNQPIEIIMQIHDKKILDVSKASPNAGTRRSEYDTNLYEDRRASQMPHHGEEHRTSGSGMGGYRTFERSSAMYSGPDSHNSHLPATQISKTTTVHPNYHSYPSSASYSTKHYTS